VSATSIDIQKDSHTITEQSTQM